MGIHARDSSKRERLIELLPDKARSVHAIANEVGLARSYLYRLRDRDPEVAEAWARREGRQAPGAPKDAPDELREIERRARRSALKVLAEIAGDTNVEARDRVAAAKALVQTTSPGKQGRAAEPLRLKVLPPAPLALTPAEVAAALQSYASSQELGGVTEILSVNLMQGGVGATLCPHELFAGRTRGPSQEVTVSRPSSEPQGHRTWFLRFLVHQGGNHGDS